MWYERTNALTWNELKRDNYTTTTYCWGHFWYIFAFPYLDKQYCLKARNIIILKEALEQSTAHATQLPERIALQKVALQMYIKIC